MRPAAHLLFLSRQEKKAKEGDPTVCDGLLGSEPQFTEPSARPEGAVLRTAVKWVSDPNNPQPGVLGCGVRRGTHCAPAALRSNNHGESVDEAGVSCGTPATPRPARPRRIQKGLSTKTASRAIAALGPISRAQAPRAAQPRPSAAMAREDVRLWVPFTMRRGAQRPADQGSRLSERNAVERVRARPRWTRAPQVARSEAKGRSV